MATIFNAGVIKPELRRRCSPSINLKCGPALNVGVAQHYRLGLTLLRTFYNDISSGRLLCELVRKRERLKAEHTRVWERCVMQTLRPERAAAHKLLRLLRQKDASDIFTEPVDLQEVILMIRQTDRSHWFILGLSVTILRYGGPEKTLVTDVRTNDIVKFVRSRLIDVTRQELSRSRKTSGKTRDSKQAPFRMLEVLSHLHQPSSCDGKCHRFFYY